MIHRADPETAPLFVTLRRGRFRPVGRSSLAWRQDPRSGSPCHASGVLLQAASGFDDFKKIDDFIIRIVYCVAIGALRGLLISSFGI